MKTLNKFMVELAEMTAPEKMEEMREEADSLFSQNKISEHTHKALLRKIDKLQAVLDTACDQAEDIAMTLAWG